MQRRSPRPSHQALAAAARGPADQLFQQEAPTVKSPGNMYQFPVRHADRQAKANQARRFAPTSTRRRNRPPPATAPSEASTSRAGGVEGELLARAPGPIDAFTGLPAGLVDHEGVRLALSPIPRGTPSSCASSCQILGGHAPGTCTPAPCVVGPNAGYRARARAGLWSVGYASCPHLADRQRHRQLRHRAQMNITHAADGAPLSGFASIDLPPRGRIPPPWPHAPPATTPTLMADPGTRGRGDRR